MNQFKIRLAFREELEKHTGYHFIEFQLDSDSTLEGEKGFRPFKQVYDGIHAARIDDTGRVVARTHDLALDGLSVLISGTESTWIVELVHTLTDHVFQRWTVDVPVKTS